jgi:hypothetical protein
MRITSAIFTIATLALSTSSVMTQKGWKSASMTDDNKLECIIPARNRDSILVPGTMVSLQDVQGVTTARHRNFELHNDNSDNSNLFTLDSNFIVARALSGHEGAVSFRSVNFPNRYLRHSGFVLWLHEYQNDPLYQHDASFHIRDGFVSGVDAKNVQYLSFESVNYPSFFMQRNDNGAQSSVKVHDFSIKFDNAATWKVSVDYKALDVIAPGKRGQMASELSCQEPESSWK